MKMTKKVRSPNPQGKGLCPVVDRLTDLQHHVNAPPKPITQIASELFTSLFILESRIRFKPVLDRKYWLYRKGDSYHLSLIGPKEWHQSLSGHYIGECRLHPDLTWSLALSEETQNNRLLMEELHSRRQAFDKKLESAEQLNEALPVFVNDFSYHSRVLASALAFSLASSMRQTNILSLSFDQALHLERGLITQTHDDV
jgi:hypothetical protein